MTTMGQSGISRWSEPPPSQIDLILIGQNVTKKRKSSAKTERAGLIAVDGACNVLNLIWRDLFQDDVGVDGTIEICLGDFPTGKIVGAQVKSGMSYIKSETVDEFKFYPRADDLEYWSRLSIPLFLLVHHPNDNQVYWYDVSKHIKTNSSQEQTEKHIIFPKTQKMDEGFTTHLLGCFDLMTYDQKANERLHQELCALTHVFGDSRYSIEISALDMFVEGLWGLCSKVQFHASILTMIIRRSIAAKNRDALVRYTFSRSDLYPFLTRYFSIISNHHLATVDANDINASLYAKMELPTFIAPLTTNGRAFVEFLREGGHPHAHDNQYFTLELSPIEQIEVYSSFKEERSVGVFGHYTDVLAISFNQYLDYYSIQHYRRSDVDGLVTKIISQVMYFYELTEYIDRVFSGVSKDNILLRHLDLPLTPLICWLEQWYESDQPFHIGELVSKTNSEQFGLHDELISIHSGLGTGTITEPPLPQLPICLLYNGETLVLET